MSYLRAQRRYCAVRVHRGQQLPEWHRPTECRGARATIPARAKKCDELRLADAQRQNGL